MGILDQQDEGMDPRTQGILQAAFALMKASGASRMPVGMGEALGQAGAAGTAAYAQAQNEALAQKMKRMQIAQAEQEMAQRQQMGAIDMNDPEALRRYGIVMKKPEYITHAEKIEKQRSQDAEVAGMRSQTAVIPPDQQELQQAADQGMPAPAPAVVKKGGIFGPLMSAPFPDIAEEAKARQAEVDNAKRTDPETIRKERERLYGLVEKRMDRENSGAGMHVIKDPSSSTGWSYTNQRGQKINNAPPPSSSMAQSIAEGSFSKDAIEQAAGRYRMDGTLPTNMGRGVAGQLVTSKILNRAAEMARDEGKTGEAVRLDQIGFKANQQALGQLEKQRNLVLAFENNAVRNADVTLAESEKVDRTGSPAINRWLLAGKKNVLGDPGVARLDTAVRTFVNEYAKVTTSVTGGSITSDTARKEIEQLLNSAHNPQQVRDVIGLMKQEMENRRKAYEYQVNDLKGRMLPAASATNTPKNQPSKEQLDALKAKYSRQ